MEKLIDAETEKQLKAKFGSAMKGTVDVKVFTNPIIVPGDTQTPEINRFALQLSKELAALDPRIIVQELPTAGEEAIKLNITTSPSIAIGADLGYRIVYNGAPLGYEATGFIETLVLVSARDSGLSEANRKALSLVDKDTLLQVFVTPTCPYCPKSVLTANRIAIETKGKVFAECVEASENQALAAKMNVSSVPQQTVNGNTESSTLGAISDEMLVKQVIKFGVPKKYASFEKAENEARAAREKLPESPSAPVYISDNNFADALKKYPALVVDCWAEWCVPCKMLAPVIDALAAENAGKIVFGKLNTDENPKASNENNIHSIPTMLVYKDGAQKGVIVGVHPKEELKLKIEELLK